MKRVLFLCSGNYYRSRFAEIVFNRLAKERGLAWRADSAGLNVDAGGWVNEGPLSVWTREACAARGLEVEQPERMPRQVRAEEFERADLVVAMKEAEHRGMMERRHPEWADRIRYWHIHDLDVVPAGGGLTDVEAHVKRLVEELAAGGEG
jgi:protein-tyrosine phosphatase